MSIKELPVGPDKPESLHSYSGIFAQGPTTQQPNRHRRGTAIMNAMTPCQPHDPRRPGPCGEPACGRIHPAGFETGALSKRHSLSRLSGQAVRPCNR
jgi:hypothetical protein